MNSIYRFFILAVGIFAMFISCEDEFGPRKESTPVIESATISPTTFTFGDSITLDAQIIDPATTLTTLTYEVVSSGRVLTTGEIPLSGDSYDSSETFFVPLVKDETDNADVVVNIVVTNVLNGAASYQVEGLTGNRPAYSQLYLVTDNGTVAVLSPLSSDEYQFEGDNLTLDPTISFKIAEKLNDDNTIDYSGDVFGNVNGKLEMIAEDGESGFVYTADADYTKGFVFDSYSFEITTTGSTLGADDISLTAFSDVDADGETLMALTRTLENGKTYTVFGSLGDPLNIYNPDFFERISDSQVTFLGETGEYTIYYNSVRKNIIVGVDNPAYPEYLLACGYGLGYPTNVSSDEIGAVYSGHHKVHTSWGFGNVLNYVLLRQISSGVYQGTFFTPGDHDNYAGFKPFENTGWGNEKKAGSFTFTGEQIITGDNDWTIASDSGTESANYRFTIDLNTNTVNIEKVTL
ncbi:hypothetical protein [Mangrovibacterium diazotrophicum]|uniref:Uncharacterized protein n=1 Tax=Mangrovibacterium diazotrophicum TaxID=1261403 RepID=A0A419W693_9BACT|nr:hypothetical protein [Mangrovibacterium diazotrophicum]RKD90940.1 hypothetical protein BC643_1285 [Mangrovibacterium diazotrophicum]